MSRYRDLVQPTILLIAALAAITGVDAKSSRKAAASTEVARNEIEPADGGYIIVTAPRRAKGQRPTAPVPIGATIRIDETTVRSAVVPARSIKR